MLKTSNFVSTVPTAGTVGAVPNPTTNLPGQIGHKVYWFQPLSSTTLGPNLGGTTGAFGGTISTAITAGSANFARFRRAISTSASAINSAAGIGQTYARYFRASTGGFEAQFIFAAEGTPTLGHGLFCGFSTLLTAPTTADITTYLSCVGVGYSLADAAAGTWSIFHNDGSGAATQTPIVGMTRSATTGYRMVISIPTGASATFTISVFDALTNAVILAPTVLSSNIPASGVVLSPSISSYTGASATPSVISLADLYVTAPY